MKCSNREIKAAKGSLCVFKSFMYCFCPLYFRRRVWKTSLSFSGGKGVGKRKNLNYLLMSKTPWCIKLNFKLLIQRFFCLMYDFRIHSNLVFRALGKLRSTAWMHSNYKIKRWDIELLSMPLTYFQTIMSVSK